MHLQHSTCVVTWSAVHRLSAPTGAALCVLFSGGTFLYAACIHVLPSALGSKITSGQLATLLAGCVAPLALVFVMGHGH